jgi:hypothetical protein
VRAQKQSKSAKAEIEELQQQGPTFSQAVEYFAQREGKPVSYTRVSDDWGVEALQVGELIFNAIKAGYLRRRTVGGEVYIWVVRRLWYEAPDSAVIRL